MSKLRLKYDPPGALRGEAGNERSVIERALRSVEDQLGGGVSVDVEISFGRATPDDGGVAEAYARELEKNLSIPGVTQARATLIKDAARGSGGSREPVNFLRDQVVMRVPMIEDSAASRTPLASVAGDDRHVRTVPTRSRAPPRMRGSDEPRGGR